jgi:hypothetical protein
MSGRRISQRLTQRLRRLEVRRTCGLEALACAPVVQNNRKIDLSSAPFGQRAAQGGRAHGGKARRSLARWNPASSFLSGRWYHPSRRSFRQTGGRQRWTARPTAIGDRPRLPRTSICTPDCRRRHRLRGRPTLHPEGCSSSCFRSSSMLSRMNDEAFLYLVYGTSCLMNSHVA